MDMVTFWNSFATYVRARFARTERGASLVEYALLVAFIAIVCIAAVAFFGSRVTDSFSRSGSRLG